MQPDRPEQPGIERRRKNDLTKSELSEVIWQNLPDHARIALEHDGVTWNQWKRAGTWERWMMLRRVLGN